MSASTNGRSKTGPKRHLWSAPTLHNTQAGQPASGDDRERHGYLMVIQRESAFVYPLPQAGVALIGRGADVHLQIADYLASRKHAQLVIDGERVSILDLDSQNGTSVNDVRVDGLTTLNPGDVITIANTMLIFHSHARPLTARRMVDKASFHQRLGEELNRAVSFGRDLTVVAVRLPDADDRAIEQVLMSRLRAVDTATREPDGVLLILMPEADADVARELAEGVHAALARVDPGCRMGYSCCPRDGAQIGTLIAGARAAAETAGRGLIIDATDAYRVIDTGDAQIIAADLATLRLYTVAERIASADLPVLICGETGAGKELVARAIHHFSPRGQARMVTLNCAALQDNLIESELFGHERGAFTGAHQTKVGLLEAASGGTVFLDEIAELSLIAQAKLLRALETQRVLRVGGLEETAIDVRLVAATHRDLKREVEGGRFREDLFFRLRGALLWLPPLRDRPRELPILARKFLGDACARVGRGRLTITVDAMREFTAYHWPGNIRQLRNVMEFAATLVTGDALEPWHVPDLIDPSPPGPGADTRPVSETAALEPAPEFKPLQQEIRELEIRRIGEAMAATGGNKTQAARLIKMPLRTFLNKLKRYDLS